MRFSAHATPRQRLVLRGIGFQELPHNSACDGIMWHYPERPNWQSSGLLIRGFGVRVPGGAPGGLHVSVGAIFTFGSDIPDVTAAVAVFVAFGVLWMTFCARVFSWHAAVVDVRCPDAAGDGVVLGAGGRLAARAAPRCHVQRPSGARGRRTRAMPADAGLRTSVRLQPDNGAAGWRVPAAKRVISAGRPGR